MYIHKRERERERKREKERERERERDKYIPINITKRGSLKTCLIGK